MENNKSKFYIDKYGHLCYNIKYNEMIFKLIDCYFSNVEIIFNNPIGLIEFEEQIKI